MTWTKLGGDFTDKPALLSVPRGVRFLHVEALVWCNQHGTDGHIPRHAVGRITDEPAADQAAQRLVDAGLWAATEDGWTIVDFLDDQPSRADVQRTQGLAKQRTRRQRQHRGGDHSLCTPKYCDALSRVTNAVSNGVSHDTRTEPYRTDPKERRIGREGEGGANAPSASATDATAPSPASQRHGPPPGQPARIFTD